MKVKIQWSEEVSYVSTIEVDEAEVREWLSEPTRALTGSDIQHFLDAGEESDWFDACDTSADFVSVDERGLDGAEIVS